MTRRWQGVPVYGAGVRTVRVVVSPSGVEVATSSWVKVSEVCQTVVQVLRSADF